MNEDLNEHNNDNANDFSIPKDDEVLDSSSL